MREIKFRAWHRERKCWLDSVSVYDDGSWGGSLIEEVGEVEGYDERECELMQYTGLKDKNGKEIYEGDVCKHPEPTETNEVKYYDGEWHLDPHGLHLADEHDLIEVIGNIYENPELLKDTS